jgi:hypothetical protein
MLASVAFLLLAMQSALAQRSDWIAYENESYGYSVLYPADVFREVEQGQRQGVPQNSPEDSAEPAEEDDEPGYRPDDQPRDAARGDDASDADGQPAGDGATFVSRDGRARLVVFGTANTEGFTPTEYRSVILREFEGYDEITYGPRGQTWFVLSGFRGDDIYYQKVMFSCGGRIINALSVTFPRDEKPFYEPIIERLEDNFRPARGGACSRLATG